MGSTQQAVLLTI